MSIEAENTRRTIQQRLLETEVSLLALESASFALVYRYNHSLRELSAACEALARANSTLDAAHALVRRRL